MLNYIHEGGKKQQTIKIKVLSIQVFWMFLLSNFVVSFKLRIHNIKFHLYLIDPLILLQSSYTNYFNSALAVEQLFIHPVAPRSSILNNLKCCSYSLRQNYENFCRILNYFSCSLKLFVFSLSLNSVFWWKNQSEFVRNSYSYSKN